ncbi:MAG: iron ABC transporter permease [bacterium]|nr:iron ABC transporter permease [bacterium]
MSTEFWFRAATNSAIIVAGVSALSLVIAVPGAWLLERTDLPGAGGLRKVFTLTYALPSYLLAISWVVLANPNVGWINLWAERWFGIERLVNVYHLGGVIFIETSVVFTILFFNFWSGLRQMDPALEEAARLAGAGPWRVFFTITAPILRGNIFAGLIAVGLASLASFGVPAIVAAPARKFVLTTAIYAKIQEGSPQAFNEAMVIALGMAAVTLGLVILAGRGSKRKVGLVSGKASRAARVELGRWRYPLAVGLYGLWGVLVLLPLAALVLSSFFAEPGVLRASNLSLRAWKYVLFTLTEFKTALANSLLTAGAAAFAVLLAAMLVAIVAWQGHHKDRRAHRWVGHAAENGAMFCFSIPGTVLALCLIVVLARFSLMNTLSILVVAYGLKYATLGFQTVRPSAFLVHPSLLEAAQLAGAGFFQRFYRIWLPLLKAPLFAAAILVFMPCFSELTMSILLYGPGTETLGVVLFNLQEYADRSSAAVVGTLLLGVIVVFRIVAERIRG